MKDDQALCIGGPLDGQIRTIVGSTVSTNPSGAVFAAQEPGEAAPALTVDNVSYRLEVFRSGSRRFHFYVEYSLSHGRVMEALITSYQQARSQRPA